MAERSNTLPVVALLVLAGILFALVRMGGTPHHLVIVRFDPRLERAEPVGATPRLDALSGASVPWPARSEQLEGELEALGSRLAEDDWTVQVGNVVDVALENAAAARERGDPGPYFVSLNLAAPDRGAVDAAVGRVLDGMAPILPPADTVYVVVDPRGGRVRAHGPGVGPVRDPAGDAAALVRTIEGWIAP